MNQPTAGREIGQRSRIDGALQRSLPAQISIRAAEPGAVDDGLLRLQLSVSSETPYLRTSWWDDPWIEVLGHKAGEVDLARLNDGAPVFANHDRYMACGDTPLAGLGAVEKSWIENGRVYSNIVISRREALKDLRQDIADGLVRNVSIAYQINERVLTKASSNGQPDEYRVTSWTPYEVSLVDLPADPSVGLARTADQKDQSAPRYRVVDLSPAEGNQRGVQPMDNATQTPAGNNQTANDGARAAEVQAAERQRAADILTIGDDHADIGGREMARAAVNAGASVAEFNAQLLAAKRSAGSKDQIQFGQGARSKDNLAEDPKRGYRNYGEFCKDVVSAISGNSVERLARAATTFGNESAGPDGGYAVPPQFASEIASVAYAEGSLLSLCDDTPITGNTMTFPKDETTPWGSTGITAAWEGEGAQSTPKKPALGESQLKLRKLKVLVAASDELLADASAMSTHITRKCGEAVEWKVNDAIINGTGSGMPLGVMVAASTVSQAKETSQTAATINGANVSKMYGRVIKGPGANLAWIVHPDAINQIMLLTVGDQPIWTPPQAGFKSAPNGFLLGRPIIESDACQTLGTVGDIILGNFNGYRAITKAGGAEFAQSMHLWFDQDLMAFRLVFRMDGQPALAAAVSPKNGSSTRSHFATLATRG